MSNITDALKKITGSEKAPEKAKTDLSPVDMIATKSLIDVVENGAFAGLSDHQRQEATFRTGTVVASGVFELGKAFDPEIDQREAYKRGAVGLLSLFEVAFSAKRVYEGLSQHDAVRSRKRRDSHPHQEDEDTYRRSMNEDAEE